MENKPFFSVIVVCLNAEDLIKETLNSILQQSCIDFEIIVKDGISKDNTLGMIPDDYRIRVFSEKDCCIYDAMNQATNYASGEYVIYMNCGDAFATVHVLEDVKKAIGSEKVALVYGDYLRDGVRHRHAAKITDFYLFRTSMCHQALFFNLDVLKQFGSPYDLQYKVMADYDLELRLHKGKFSTLYTDSVICTYLGGGYSESPKGIELRENERKQIRKTHYSLFQRVLFICMWKATLPKLRMKLIGKKSPVWIRVLYRRLVNRLNRR